MLFILSSHKSGVKAEYVGFFQDHIQKTPKQCHIYYRLIHYPKHLEACKNPVLSIDTECVFCVHANDVTPPQFPVWF